MSARFLYHPVCILLLGCCLFIDCKGQNDPDQSNSAPLVAKGDTVKELDSSILYVFQDKNNVYWFGSDGQGLYRYDGKVILHFKKKHGLCDNQVRGIQEDKAGNIYINTVRGISKFDGKAFTTLNPETGRSFKNEWKSAADDLWFPAAQDSGLVYRYDGKHLHRLKMPQTKLGEAFILKYPRSQYPYMTFSPYDVYTIYKDSKGSIWFGTGTLGVCRYNGNTFTWITEDDLTELDDGPANGVRSIIEDADGKFWFSNSLYRYNLYENGTAKKEKGKRSYSKEKGIGSLDELKDGTLHCYLCATKDSSGALWIATYNAGVYSFDGKAITHYAIEEPGKTVTLFSVYKDRQGTLWLGTHQSGAYRFNGKTFEKFGTDRDTNTRRDEHIQNAPYVLPAPKGWATERFAIPIAFAPQLPYKGVEEACFAPGWAKQKNDDYWSYAILWYLEGEVTMNSTVLESNLSTYYTGLIAANSPKTAGEKPMPVEVTFEEVKKDKGDLSSYAGTIKMRDYMTQAPLVLNCKAHVRSCPGKANTVLFFELSPQPLSHPIWLSLGALWLEFKCEKE